MGYLVEELSLLDFRIKNDISSKSGRKHVVPQPYLSGPYLRKVLLVAFILKGRALQTLDFRELAIYFFKKLVKVSFHIPQLN